MFAKMSVMFKFVVVVSVVGAVVFGVSAQEKSESQTFTISEIRCDSSNLAVTIVFDSPVKAADLRNKIRFVPAIRNSWNRDKSAPDKEITFRGAFAYNQTYQISIPEGLVHNGRSYKTTLTQFTFPPQPPSVRYSEGATTPSERSYLERESRQLVPLSITNLEQVEYRGITVPPLLYPYFEWKNQAKADLNESAVVQSLSQQTARLREVVADATPFCHFLPDPATRSHIFLLDKQSGSTENFTAPLTFRENATRGALEVVQFIGRQGESVSQTGWRTFNLTNLGLTIKAGPNDLLVWTTALDTGQIKPGATVLGFQEDGTILTLGESDQNGLLYLQDGEVCNALVDVESATRTILKEAALDVQQLGLIMAITPEDVAVMDKAEWAVVFPSGHFPEQPSEPSVGNWKAEMFTERGIYRPGETVHFKAVLRQVRDRRVVPPAPHNVQVKCVDSRSSTIYSETHLVSAYGTIHGQIDLPAKAKLGSYQLRLSLRNQDPREFSSFLVEEFVPPRHFTEITFATESITTLAFAGKPTSQPILKATIHGLYYAGGHLKNARVRWQIATTGTSFSANASEYNGFQFGVPDSSENMVETGESMLNENGTVDIRVPLSPAVMKGQTALVVQASVVDFDGRVASSSERFQMRAPYQLGIRVASLGANLLTEVPIRMVVLDRHGKPTQEGEIELRVLSSDRVFVRKRDTSGNIRNEYTSIYSPVHQIRIPLASDVVEYPYHFSGNGSYRIEATYIREGQPISQTRYSLGIGEGASYPNCTYYWNSRRQETCQKLFEGYQEFNLQTDRDVYVPGDVIELDIGVPSPVAGCLVCVEQQDIISYQLLEPGQKQVRIPVTADMYPNVFVTVHGITPRGQLPFYPGDPDLEKPSLIYKGIRISVNEEIHQLEISMKPEDIRNQPGEYQEIAFQITDHQGTPVDAEVMVAVVDERVLALTDYKTPRLNNLLDFSVPLHVFTQELRALLQSQSVKQLFPNDPLTGGGGADSDGVPLKIRKDFRPVAFYAPALVTDEHGWVHVDFEFPDTMTTYRVFAVACDRRDGVATFEDSALVTRDFYIEPGMPMFARSGDEMVFQVLAFNKSDQGGEISLDLVHGDPITTTIQAATASLPPYDQALVPVQLSAQSVGKTTMTFTAAFADQVDAVQLPFRVESALPTYSDRQTGKFNRQHSFNYQFPEGASLPADGQLTDENFNIVLSISTNPLLRIQSLLRELLAYPYGCVEQVSSKVIPLAGLRSLARQGLLPGFSLEEIDSYIQVGVDRLSAMQTSGGGFAYWAGQRTPSLAGSLYALSALRLLHESHYPLQEEMLWGGVSYLAKEIKSAASASGDEYHDFYHDWGMAAYILSVYSKRFEDVFVPRVNEKLMQGFENQLCLLWAESIVYPEDHDLHLEQLLALMEGSRQAFSQGYFSTRYRGSAMELLTLLAVQPDHPRVDAIADEFQTKMARGGLNGSTADMGWVLYSLGQYLAHQITPDQGVVHVEVAQDGLPAKSVEVGLNETVDIQLDAKQFFQAPNLKFKSEQDANIFFSFDFTYPRLDLSKEGLQRAFSIEKRIKNNSGTQDVRVGDVLEITLLVTPRLGQELFRFVALDDPLPAGLVAINSALASEEPVNDDSIGQYWSSGGYWGLYPNHQELREDRVLAFRDRLWRWRDEPVTYQFKYHARAVCAGRFYLPPTKVELMYEPNSASFSPGQLFEILPR